MFSVYKKRYQARQTASASTRCRHPKSYFYPHFHIVDLRRADEERYGYSE